MSKNEKTLPEILAARLDDLTPEQRKIRRQHHRTNRRRAEKQVTEQLSDEAPAPPTVKQLSAEEVRELLSPERITSDVMSAFVSLGGVDGLVKWGAKYPKDFYALWGRVVGTALPKDSAGSGAGSGASGSVEDIINALDATSPAD